MSIRMRHTKGHTANRRSHHALKQTMAVKDKESGNLRLPHRLDEATGMYRGKQIAAARVEKSKGPKAKKEHKGHDHSAEQVAGSKGIMGKIAGAMRPKARSGMGGGV